MQSVSTLGGESSVVNKGTAVDSTISRLNMNEGVQTNTAANFLSLSGGIHPSNIHSVSKFVEGSLTDKANVTEKDVSNLSMNVESVCKFVEGSLTDKANVTENAESNLNMNETHVISTSGTKFCTDSNSVTGSKVIERSKDDMSLDMSKDCMTVDGTDPVNIQELNVNMNMLEKVLPATDQIVVDKAKPVGKLSDNIIPPSGSNINPVQIDDSVLPTSEVLHHVHNELKLVEKRLNNSEQNKTNNSSSSVQDLTMP